MNNWNIRTNFKIMEDKCKYWAARDTSGALFLTDNKPERCNFEYGMWISKGDNMMLINGFPNLTWDDEPLEVELHPVINDLDAKAKEYADSVTDKEELKNIIISAYKAGYNV